MANDRFLIDYLPPYMQEYLEIKSIMETEQPEIDALWSACERTLADQYIMDATEYGVMRWEGMLNISPKATDTLDERKFRILARLNRELPYTLTKMKESLTVLCGADGFVIDLQANRYHIEIKLAVGNHNNYGEVQKILNTMIPANMTQYISLMYNPHRIVGLLRHIDLVAYTHEKIRNEILPYTPSVEYTKLAYIESNGTQYIDTQFVCNGNSKIEAEFELLTAENGGAFLYGGGSGTARIEAYPWNGMVEMNYGSLTPFIGSIIANRKFYVCQNKGNFTLSYPDGYGSWTQDEGTQAFNCVTPMAIFALNRGSIQYPTGGMRLYWFKIYDDDTLVRDFIPCINKNGEVGLWDKVTNQFYGNSGTGTFIESEVLNIA